jgi:hypothetical protein
MMRVRTGCSSFQRCTGSSSKCVAFVSHFHDRIDLDARAARVGRPGVVPDQVRGAVGSDRDMRLARGPDGFGPGYGRFMTGVGVRRVIVDPSPSCP